MIDSQSGELHPTPESEDCRDGSLLSFTATPQRFGFGNPVLLKAKSKTHTRAVVIEVKRLV
jgi:hypothetical protein